MRIGFLGTGGAFTDFRVNYHTNLVVFTSAGPVLIDCGGTGVQSLKEMGISASEVPGVIVTHIHSDHVGGIEQLAWERFYAGPMGPQFDTTWLRSTRDVAEGLRATLSPGVHEVTLPSGTTVTGGFDVLFEMITVVAGAWFEIGDVRFRLVPVPHVMGHGVRKASYGVELEDADGRIFFTSDTTFEPDHLTDGYGFVIHDCSFLPWFEGTVHTHYDELSRLPVALRSRIVLVHHTEVPAGLDVRDLGFVLAGERHDVLDIRGTNMFLERRGERRRLR